MLKRIRKGAELIVQIYNFFKHGLEANLNQLYIKIFLSTLKNHLNNLYLNFKGLNDQPKSIHDFRIKKLQHSVNGLQQILSKDSFFTYSILLPVLNPNSHVFKVCLDSILNQNNPSCEVLIGFQGKASSEIEQIVKSYKDLHKQKIREFTYDSYQSELAIINLLAKEAIGSYLFVMNQEDWVRPDLLFRFEQTLRLMSYPEKTILYCDENQITEKDFFIPGSERHKPNQLHFPYFFEPFSANGLLIPKRLWDLVEGLRSNYLGAEFEDLLLRLDIQGAIFHRIPVKLYSMRANVRRQIKSQTALLQALTDYSSVKKLNWIWSAGFNDQGIRALPQISEEHTVQIIIPFKDQKEVTLSCIQHVLKQKEIKCKITAVDNRSEDKTIAKEIEKLGGEVLYIDEPFNYSRLNNFAVKNTKFATNCDLILFLNNDVELEPHALLEMVRWIDQPKIGLVGCRLHYPNGLLQHGGTKLVADFPHSICWDHEEIFSPLEKTQVAKKIRVSDGLTAACLLVKRQNFIEVGGFDEVWFPIYYSDLHFVMKLKHRGFLCLYTPFANGIHYEGLSEGKSIHDYEGSWWLHQLVCKKQKFKYIDLN